MGDSSNIYVRKEDIILVNLPELFDLIMNSPIKKFDFTPLKGSKGSLGINLSPYPIRDSPTNTQYY